MSKLVKGVGRAVKKVVKGAANVVKKVAKSPIGKALIVAAGAYFAVPAVMGLMGAGGAAAAGGLSGLAGASANLSAAWSGLTGAGSALMAGNFSGAASSLGQGFLGNTATSAAQQAANAAWAGQGATAAAQTATGAATTAGGAATTAGGAAASPASTSIWGKALDTAMSPTVLPSLIQGAGKAAEVVGNAYLAKEAAEEEDKRERQRIAEEEARRTRNLGTNLFSQYQFRAPTGFADRFTPRG